MKKNQMLGLVYIFIFLLIIVGIVFFVRHKNSQPGPYDEFAQCLTDEEVTYYGAFWCPNCQRQREMFKKSYKHIAYVECSNANKSQNDLCEAAGIEAYPTWEFADGSRLEGVQSFEVLAEKTACVAPETN